MQLRLTADPATHRDGRGGETPRDDVDGLARGWQFAFEVDGVVVSAEHGPSLVGRAAGHGDVAAEADEDTAAELTMHEFGAVVGGQSLGGGAQIELDADGQLHDAFNRIKQDRLPAGDRPQVHGDGIARRRHRGERGVVAPVAQCTGDRGVDETVGDLAGAFALQCGLLWRNRFRPLQQIGFVIGFAVFLGALVDRFASNGPIGVALWVFGAACVMGGLRRLLIDPTVAEMAGAAVALAGCAFLISDWAGFGQVLALATAWALVAPAVVRGITAERHEQILFGVIGAAALVVIVPGSISYFAFEAGIATGLVVWMCGAIVAALGIRGLVRQPLLAEVLGVAFVIIGAAVCGAQNSGLAPLIGLVTAVGLIALGTRPGLAIMSLFGSVALLINVPWTIHHFFPGRGRVPFLLLVSGLLILGVAVLLARTGGRLREEVGSKRHDIRHAA